MIKSAYYYVLIMLSFIYYLLIMFIVLLIIYMELSPLQLELNFVDKTSRLAKTLTLWQTPPLRRTIPQQCYDLVKL